MLNSYIRRSAERDMMKITPETMTQKPFFFSLLFKSFFVDDLFLTFWTYLKLELLNYVKDIWNMLYKQISQPLKANVLEARHLSTSISTYLRIIFCLLSSLLRVDLFLDFFRFNHFRHHVLLAKCSWVVDTSLLAVPWHFVLQTSCRANQNLIWVKFV